MKSLSVNYSACVLLFWSLPSISMLEAYKEKCRKLNQAISKMKSVKIVTIKAGVLNLNKVGT